MYDSFYYRFVCRQKVFVSHAYERNSLLIQNVEALSRGEEPYPDERRKCIDEGGFGIWHQYAKNLVLNRLRAK